MTARTGCSGNSGNRARRARWTTKSRWRSDNHDLRKRKDGGVASCARGDIYAGEDLVRTPRGADAPGAGTGPANGVPGGRPDAGRQDGRGAAPDGDRPAVPDVGTAGRIGAGTGRVGCHTRTTGGSRAGEPLSGSAGGGAGRDGIDRGGTKKL